jgi:hypothetical protein
MYLNSLAMLQLFSGISKPLFSHPSIITPCLPHGLLTAIRTTLHEAKSYLHITDTNPTPSPRVNDCYLMDNILLIESRPEHLQNINACRLYLQVQTLSDITSGDGLTILPTVFTDKPALPSYSTYAWPRQSNPSKTCWSHWRTAIRKTFLLHRR